MPRITECRGVAALALTILILVAISFGRTIIVAADGSGDFSTIMEATDSARAYDSILVRDGDYWGNNDFGEEFVLDSGMFLYAEHPGSVNIYEGGEIGVGTASITGFRIFGNFMVITQFMLYVYSGQARIWNCQLFPAADHGCQLAFECGGHAPYVRNCGLSLSGANDYAWNLDSTDIAMPYNSYGTLDTTVIHHHIRDGYSLPGRGFVTVSPVLDTFQWLAVEPRILPARTVTFTIAPNPCYGTCRLEFRTPTVLRDIRVFDILGRQVFTQRIPTGALATSLNLDLPFASGSYWVQVRSADETWVRAIRVIK